MKIYEDDERMGYVCGGTVAAFYHKVIIITKIITKIIQRHFKDISKIFQRYFKDISNMKMMKGWDKFVAGQWQQ